jgi:hypothetical protein
VGELIALGRAKGLAMPLNEALLRMIHEIEGGRRAMRWENLEELAGIMEERKLFAF